MIRRVAAHFVLGLRAPWRSRLVAALLVVLAAVVAKIFFHESISTPGLIGIVLIVVGVVLCNFFGANH